MKSLKFLLLAICLLFVAAPAAEAVVRPVTAEPATTSAVAQQTSKKEVRQEKRMERKAVKQELKQAIRDWKKEGASDTDTLLLVLIAILLPPLAMAIYDGISNRFWISLLLTLLFYVPGLIYTLVVILGGK